MGNTNGVQWVLWGFFLRRRKEEERRRGGGRLRTKRGPCWGIPGRVEGRKMGNEYNHNTLCACMKFPENEYKVFFKMTKIPNKPKPPAAWPPGCLAVRWDRELRFIHGGVWGFEGIKMFKYLNWWDANTRCPDWAVSRNFLWIIQGFTCLQSQSASLGIKKGVKQSKSGMAISWQIEASF